MLLLASINAFGNAGDNAEPSFVVVVNKTVPEARLTPVDLRAIFSIRKRSWSDGSPIRVFVLQESDSLHHQFCQSALHSYPYVLRDHWDRMTFSGTGVAPTVVKNQQEMVHMVVKTPGAIGYVHTSSILDENHNLTVTYSYPERSYSYSEEQ
ncbi:substrate-binding domain-containing protein [Zhongshania aliphaticivorans]|uniref:substrate-binding domain-containing protein n=1 Tax=Zhongshania aliphaticivorans TaxID=1470434 RepID=UPI0013304101|nr:substrate-binding domain-containing protein [Zhongshania aliphaticivorans]